MLKRFVTLGILVGLVLAASPLTALELEGDFDGKTVDLELPGLIGPMEIERATDVDGPWSLIESRAIGCTQYCSYQDYEIRPGNVFFYRIWVPHRDGTKDLYGPVRVEIPQLSSLGLASMASPNPFAHHTTVRFNLPAMGSVVSDIRLDFVDASGRIVRAYTKRATPGSHSVAWDGRDENGETLPTGVYFYRISVPGFTETGRLLHLK